MPHNVDRDRADKNCAQDQSPITIDDARAELARLRRVDALARQWAAVLVRVYPPTVMGEADPDLPRLPESALHRAERALLDEIRRGGGA